eukprot:CAMPEP_0114141662 /NCGR_PEP_ID=MMETSP0043_2-20121206/18029_1 /TAXON_ID=464988 /ORGANISM="Hemiselmis andersenii, Strain CCMP644" /LENGTH=168 /DNA_ID=CAMNT_0001235821 /DNA_START=375 /DNA_END=878 /DNA_ORIENTATION=+
MIAAKRAPVDSGKGFVAPTYPPAMMDPQHKPTSIATSKHNAISAESNKDAAKPMPAPTALPSAQSAQHMMQKDAAGVQPPRFKPVSMPANDTLNLQGRLVSLSPSDENVSVGTFRSDNTSPFVMNDRILSRATSHNSRQGGFESALGGALMLGLGPSVHDGFGGWHQP